MARDLNKVSITGTVASRPELRYTEQGTPVALFQVASHRNWRDHNGGLHEDVEWFRVVAWDALAKESSEALGDEARAMVIGRIQTRSWVNEDGEARYVTEVIAQELIVIDPGRPKLLDTHIDGEELGWADDDDAWGDEEEDDDEEESQLAESRKEQPVGNIGGRYNIIRMLGKGGFGIVNLCEDLNQRRFVALKTFHAEHLRNRENRALFLREGGIWINLGAHPNIVQAYEISAFDDRLDVYIVLEAVFPPPGRPSPDLSMWLKNGLLSLSEALALGLDIVRGMRYATERIPGLVHHDLKPQNILVGNDGRARVSDFGLASALHEHRGADTWISESSEGGGGTWLYMAPEHFAGQAIDQRADIFAFGCILYEMLLGQSSLVQQLREGESHAKMLVSKGRLRTIPSSLPDTLTSLLKTCLAPDRAGRPVSWQALEQQLVWVYRQVIGKDAPVPPAVLATTSQDRIASSLLNLARGYLDIGKLSQAGQVADEALHKARVAEHAFYEAQALELSAKVSASRGDFDVAWARYNEAFTLAERNQEVNLQQTIANGIGLLLLDRGNLEVAESWFRAALVSAEKVGDLQNQSTIGNNLGLIAHHRKRSSKALELFGQLFELAQRQQHRRNSLIALMNIAYVLSDLGDHLGAIPLFLRGIEFAQEIGDLAGECETVGNLGCAYLDIGDVASAINVFNDHLQLARELGDRKEEQRALTGIGDCKIANGDFQAALKIVGVGMQRAREAGDKNAEAIQYSLLAFCTHKLGDSEGAAKHFARAAQLYDEVRNEPAHDDTMQLVAIMRRAIDKGVEERASARRRAAEGAEERASARRHAAKLDERLPLVRARQGAKALAGIYRDIGDLYADAGCYELAYERLLEGLQVAQAAHLWEEEHTTLDLLMVVGGALKKWDAVCGYGERLLPLVQGRYRPNELLPLFSNLALAYEQTQRWGDAAHILEQVLHITYEYNLAEDYLLFACRLAHVHIVQRATETASEYVQLANEIGKEIGPRSTLAAINLEFGKAIALLQCRRNAISHIARAEQIYRALGDEATATTAHNLVIAFSFKMPVIR